MKKINFNSDFSLSMVFIASLSGIYCLTWNLRPKDIKINQIQQCPSNVKTPIIIEQFDLSQPALREYNVDAKITVLENINSDKIGFKMFVLRCSLGMTQCEDLDTLAVPNVCHRLADQHALWTKVFSKIKPPLTCPFRKGTYYIRNGTFDLGFITRLPIEPEKLSVNLTLFENIGHLDNHKKIITRQILCMAVQVTITLSKTASNGPPQRKLPVS